MPACKNCSNTFEGKYCPQCGQKASVRRILTRDLFSDLLKKFLPWEKGFLYTTRRLLTAPGHMVHEYLDGKRVNYSKPLGYLFLIVAISVIFFSQEDYVNSLQQQGHTQFAGPKGQKAINWVFSHLSVIFMGLIPFLSLFSKRLFRRSGENYAEHLVLNVYLMAGCSLVSTPFLMAGMFLTDFQARYWTTMASMPFYLAFFVWAYLQFFHSYRVGSALKALLVYFLGYLTYILVVGIAVSVVAVVYAAF